MRRRVCLAQGETGESGGGDCGAGSRVGARRRSAVGLWTCFQSNGKSLQVCEQVGGMSWKGTRLNVPALPFFGSVEVKWTF